MAGVQLKRRLQKVSIDDLSDEQYERVLVFPSGVQDFSASPTVETNSLTASSEIANTVVLPEIPLGASNPISPSEERIIETWTISSSDSASSLLVLLFMFSVFIYWRWRNRRRHEKIAELFRTAAANLVAEQSPSSLISNLIEAVAVVAVHNLDGGSAAMASDVLMLGECWERGAGYLYGAFEINAAATNPGLSDFTASFHQPTDDDILKPVPSAAIACNLAAALQEALDCAVSESVSHSSETSAALLLSWRHKLHSAESTLRGDVSNVTLRLMDHANPAVTRGSARNLEAGGQAQAAAAVEHALFRDLTRLQFAYDDRVECVVTHRVISRFLAQLPASMPNTESAKDLQHTLWNVFHKALSTFLQPESRGLSVQQQALEILEQRHAVNILGSELRASIDAARGAIAAMRDSGTADDKKEEEEGNSRRLHQEAQVCAAALQLALRSVRGRGPVEHANGALVPQDLVLQAAEALAELDECLRARTRKLPRSGGLSIRGARQFALADGDSTPVEQMSLPAGSAACVVLDPASSDGSMAIVEGLAPSALAAGALGIQRAGELYGASGAAAQHAMMIIEGISGPLQRMAADAKAQADAHVHAFRSASQDLKAAVLVMAEDMRRTADAEASHRSRRMAERHAVADASSLRALYLREWAWAVRAVLLSFVVCAAVLSVAGWHSVGPVAVAWVRTYAALAAPSLVCGTGDAEGGRAIWHVLFGTVSPRSLSGPLSGGSSSSFVPVGSSWGPWSARGTFSDAIGTAVSGALHRMLGGLPTLSCWVLTWVGSLVLWAASAAIAYVSPALLLASLLAACVHGAWAQVLAAGWALLLHCCLMLTMHAVVLAAWHASFPRATAVEILVQQYKDVLLSERCGVPPGSAAPTLPPHADSRVRVWRVCAYFAVSGFAGVAAAGVALRAAALVGPAM